MPKVHTMFRREFGLLPGLVRGVAAGDIARSRIVADHIEFLCTYSPRGHPLFGPAQARAVMREAASQAFASYSKRVHGTATPRRSTR